MRGSGSGARARVRVVREVGAVCDGCVRAVRERRLRTGLTGEARVAAREGRDRCVGLGCCAGLLLGSVQWQPILLFFVLKSFSFLFALI